MPASSQLVSSFSSSDDSDYSVIYELNDDGDYNNNNDNNTEEYDYLKLKHDDTVFSSCTRQDPIVMEAASEQIEQFKNQLLKLKWGAVETTCEDAPFLVSQTTVQMIYQGERIHCTPLHYVCSKKRTATSTVDALVTADPVALLKKDKTTKRLPIHMALLIDGNQSYSVLRYLAEAMPQTLAEPDVLGNTPLHYAIMYSSEKIISLLLQINSTALKIPNQNGRLPLHLLCTRNCWIQNDKHNAISLQLVQNLIQLNQQALCHVDRLGRLPLHSFCFSYATVGSTTGSISALSLEVLQLLVGHNASALVVLDYSKRTPLQLSTCLKKKKKQTPSEDLLLLLSYLRKQTNIEKQRRRKQAITGFFSWKKS